MSIHFKTAVIILATLFIGVVIGYFGNNLLRPHPPFPRHEFGEFNRFLELHERILQPTETQREALRPILEKYFKIFKENAMKNRSEMMQLVDEMQKEIDPILTPEQRQRLEQRRDFARRKGPFRRGKDQPFPPREFDGDPEPERPPF